MLDASSVCEARTAPAQACVASWGGTGASSLVRVWKHSDHVVFRDKYAVLKNVL